MSHAKPPEELPKITHKNVARGSDPAGARYMDVSRQSRRSDKIFFVRYFLILDLSKKESSR